MWLVTAVKADFTESLNQQGITAFQKSQTKVPSQPYQCVANVAASESDRSDGSETASCEKIVFAASRPQPGSGFGIFMTNVVRSFKTVRL